MYTNFLGLTLNWLWFTYFVKKNNLKGDCSFQPGDYVVITGSGTGNQVYDINGFVKTLPSLNCPRTAHGCGYYKNNDNKLVNTLITFISSLFFIIC